MSFAGARGAFLFNEECRDKLQPSTRPDDQSDAENEWDNFPDDVAVYESDWESDEVDEECTSDQVVSQCTKYYVEKLSQVPSDDDEPECTENAQVAETPQQRGGGGEGDQQRPVVCFFPS